MGRRTRFTFTLKRSLSQLWQSFVAPNPLLAFLVPIFFILWFLERRLSPSSNWVPLLFTVWVTIKYGQHQRKMLIEKMNNERKWHLQNTQPLTPLEPCEWLNKLLINLWPNYMEPKLSHRFSAMMMKKFKTIKPKFIENIELQEFSLGLAPPALGLECTYWTTEENEQVLHTGFHWDTDEMSILLAITIAGRFKKRVLVVVNNLHMKGDLRIVPILDGHCVLYSFESAPTVRVGVSFAGDSESSATIEIPGISLLLERIMRAILVKTMVEPHRSCFSFPVVNLQKHVSGAIILVTIVAGKNLRATRSSSNELYKSLSSSRKKEEVDVIEDTSKFVEVRLDKVARKTRSRKRSGSTSSWDETFELILDGSTGSIYVNVFEQSSNHSDMLSLGRCKIKVKYIQDDSTVFWAIGRNNSSLAARAKYAGEPVEMTIPLEGNTSAEISVRLLVKQWHYMDQPRSEISLGILGSLSSFQATTGRTIQVVVVEARNLVAKDRSENSDPYILLQYGKTVRRTKTLAKSINPSWNQAFEFAEISGGGEYLKLKCYDADLVIDDILGSARVNLEGLEDDECRDIWVPLESADTGEVRLTIKAVKAQSALDKSKDAAPANVMLELVLLEARDLIGADLRGTSDPFVSVHYGKQKKRTKVIYKNVNPQWNQTLEFPDDGKPLELHVKDHNTLLPTSNIGYCIVNYQSMPYNETLDKWIPLVGVKKGEVHIQLTRRFHVPHHQKPSSQSANMNCVLSKTSSKISSLLKEALQLAEEDDMEQLCEKVSELESLESEQDAQISQIIREKEMLLSKISELEQVMEITQAIVRDLCQGLSPISLQGVCSNREMDAAPS